MTWAPIGKREDGGGRGQITNRIVANQAKRVMTMQKAELTKQKAELKKMNLALKQASKAAVAGEESYPSFQRRVKKGGMAQKDFDSLMNRTHASKGLQQYIKALAQKHYVPQLGNKFPRMKEEQFKEVMKEAIENPLNSYTRRGVETIERDLKRKSL